VIGHDINIFNVIDSLDKFKIPIDVTNTCREETY